MLAAAGPDPTQLHLTVFAYGATGSGKTHTMQGQRSDPGMIPRTVDAVFAKLERLRLEEPKTADELFEVAVSYYEIYNERCYDLLCPSASAADGRRPELQLRMDGAGRVVLIGQRKEPVDSFSDFMTIYRRGTCGRSTGSTLLNPHSSRSHAVLTLTVTRRDQTDPSRLLAEGVVHLIDLAGNEDGRKAFAPQSSSQMQTAPLASSGEVSGRRQAESSKINTSLFVLGKVMGALNQAQRVPAVRTATPTRDKAHHYIPFRDSKLTRLLQSALCGASHCILVATASVDPEYYMETYHTLNFAANARNAELPAALPKEAAALASPSYAAPTIASSGGKIRCTPRQQRRRRREESLDDRPVPGSPAALQHAALEDSFGPDWQSQFSSSNLGRIGIGGLGTAADGRGGERELSNDSAEDTSNAVQQLSSPVARSACSRLGRRRAALTLRTNQESTSQALATKLDSSMQANARTAAIVSAAEAGRLLSAALAQFAPRSEVCRPSPSVEVCPPDSAAQTASGGAQCVEKSMESWPELTKPPQAGTSSSEPAGPSRPGAAQLLMCSTQSPSLSRRPLGKRPFDECAAPSPPTHGLGRQPKAMKTVEGLEADIKAGAAALLEAAVCRELSTLEPHQLAERFIGVGTVYAERIAKRAAKGSQPFKTLNELSEVGFRPRQIAAFAKRNLLPSI
eukprot:SAG31_NODE_1932_length_6879_cov_123.069322_5_plen_683_part_00